MAEKRSKIKKSVIVLAERLNVRTAPNFSADVVKILNYGETLDYMSESDGWIKVKDGYIKAEYLKKESSVIIDNSRDKAKSE